MKNLKTALLAGIMLATSQAFAFITVIDVTDSTGVGTTISNAADYSFHELEGKYLSYRGRPSEAASLFEKVALNELPQGLTDVTSEINDATGTVSVTISVQGFLGMDYKYYVLKQAGN